MWEWWVQIFAEGNHRMPFLPKFMTPEFQAGSMLVFLAIAAVSSAIIFFWDWYQASKRKEEANLLLRQIDVALRPPQAERLRPVETEDVMAAVNQLANAVKLEGRRSFWTGLAQNAFFFILGTIASVVVPKLFP